MIIMKKGLLLFLIAIIFILCISVVAFSDTGTYRILDYRVKLTPRSDGTVEMEYYQKWLVTGGHIPWITIGMANSSYQIDPSKNRGNIRIIYAYNSSSWSGVRIDLDRDYLPNETFEVGFTLIQNRLFFADENNYKLDFTPGWYDRAIIENLSITIHLFAPIDKVNYSPRIARIKDQEITWNTYNLSSGRKFPVSISFPKTYMPQISTKALRTEQRGRRVSGLFLFFAIIWFFIAIAVILKASGYGKGGSLFAAGTGGRSGRSTGGGGGFGGRSSSCACACVSCACACACAGGGGAGCSKKTSHSCPICSEV
jgi:hypothetical protein